MVIPIWDRADTIELDEGSNTQWVQILRTGRWDHPKHGELLITRERLQNMVKNFKDNVRGMDLALDAGHRNQDQAYGWFEDLKMDGDRLMAKISFTPPGVRAVNERRYRYLSAEFAPTWRDPETGKVYHDVLMGAALTNRPFVKGMEPVPIMLSEDLPECEGEQGIMLVPEKYAGNVLLGKEGHEMPDTGISQNVADFLETLETGEMTSEDIDELLDNMTDEELDELDAIIPDSDDYADDEVLDDEDLEDLEDYVYAASEPPDPEVVSLSDAKGKLAYLLDNLNEETDPEAAGIIKSAMDSIDDAMDGGTTVHLTGSDNPEVAMLAEKLERESEARKRIENTLKLAEAEQELALLMHDPETQEGVITPAQAEAAMVLLTGPTDVADAFREFLANSPPVVYFSENGTAHVGDGYSGVDGPYGGNPLDSADDKAAENLRDEMILLAEEYERMDGLDPESALRLAREELMS